MNAAGRIVMIDGVPHLDEIGLAVRLGLANPTAEAAAEVYPLLELLPDEERPKPGETLEGVPVFAWLEPQAAAERLNVSGRHLQNLDGKGLPSHGRRSTKRYAVPHLEVWFGEYQLELARKGSCPRLPFSRAWRRHREWAEE